MKTKLIATAAVLTLAFPATALDGPEEPVKAIYGDLGVPDTAAEADRWLARDVAAAYKVALKADEPKPSTDFDWRYGSQDYDITEVSVGRGVAIASISGVTLMEVPVTFRNFNQPTETVTWTLCLGRRGWRVADVRGTDSEGVWRIRQMLDLPTDQLRC